MLVPKEKGSVLVEGFDLWVKLEGPSHVLSNVTPDGRMSHWWRWCKWCVIDRHALCMVHDDKWPHQHQFQTVIYCNWWKITRPPNTLMPIPQKRFQLHGHQPSEVINCQYFSDFHRIWILVFHNIVSACVSLDYLRMLFSLTFGGKFICRSHMQVWITFQWCLGRMSREVSWLPAAVCCCPRVVPGWYGSMVWYGCTRMTLQYGMAVWYGMVWFYQDGLAVWYVSMVWYGWTRMALHTRAQLP